MDGQPLKAKQAEDGPRSRPDGGRGACGPVEADVWGTSLSDLWGTPSPT
jgi:hypothetical protein